MKAPTAIGAAPGRQSETAIAERRSLRDRLHPGAVLAYLVATLLAIVFVLPFAWMLTSALKPNNQVMAIPPVWIPNPLIWSNIPDALAAMEFFKLLRNTLIITGFNIVGVTLSSVVVAYGFSRLHWPGRDALFFICLATVMIPYQVTLIPLYITYSRLGWIDTFLPLIVPAFFGVPYFIFLLRQFFMTIPGDLSDAARLDGESELGILLRIILPLARPALVVVALSQFIFSWNDYLGPLVYLRNPDMYTIGVGLASFTGEHAFQFAFQMAASAVTIIPIIVLFFVAQRAFIEGISLTGIKG